MAYKQINFEEILDTQSCLFADIYIFLALNNRYVCFGNAGLDLPDAKKERLKTQYQNQVFVLEEEYEKALKIKTATLEGLDELFGEEKIKAFRERLIGSTTIKPEELLKFVQDSSNEIVDEIYLKSTDLQKFICQSPDIVKMLESSRTIAGFAMAFSAALEFKDRSSFTQLTQACMLMDASLSFIKQDIMNQYFARSLPPDSDFSSKFKAHPEMSLQIVKSKMPGLPESVETLIICHHERIDGTGYPKALKKFEIPMLSQVLGLAVDVYEDIMYAKHAKKDIMIMEVLETYLKEINDGLHERHSKKNLETIIASANI